MPLNPGAPLTPEDLAVYDFDQISVTPVVAAGASSVVVVFNNGYTLSVDNAGAGGNNTRFWLDGPDGGECIIGPRAGASNFGSIRLRTSATTAAAANANLDTGGFIRRSTSSRKYKVDIERYEFDLDALRRLRVVSFHDRGELAAGADPAQARRYVGLVAEDVDDLGLEPFVVYDKGKPDALMYDRLTLGALQLIAALEERVDQLAAAAARVDELEQRLAALEARPAG